MKAVSKKKLTHKRIAEQQKQTQAPVPARERPPADQWWFWWTLCRSTQTGKAYTRWAGQKPWQKKLISYPSSWTASVKKSKLDLLKTNIYAKFTYLSTHLFKQCRFFMCSSIPIVVNSLWGNRSFCLITSLSTLLSFISYCLFWLLLDSFMFPI